MIALTLVNVGVLSVNCCTAPLVTLGCKRRTRNDVYELKINSLDRHLIMLLSVLLSLLSSATKLPLSSLSLQVKLHLFLHHNLTPSVTIQLCNSSSQSRHLKSSKFYLPYPQRRLFLTLFQPLFKLLFSMI